mgnify:FL=1
MATAQTEQLLQGNYRGECLRDWIARQPEDEDERNKIRMAIAMGAGISVAEFLNRLLGHEPDASLVESVTMKLEQAKDDEEPVDIEAYVKQLTDWQSKLA